MLLNVTGFESGKTVQIRIYNVTTAIEVVAWTATGVSERADGQGYSTYYYDYAVVSGDKYIVNWKDNSTPVNTASEGINEKQSGVALDSTVAKEVTLTTQAAKIAFIEKWINNKLVEGPIGTWKLYDDDNTTVLKTWTWNTETLTRSKAV